MNASTSQRRLLAGLAVALEPVVIDVAGGEIGRAPDVAAGWCRQHEEVPYAIDYYDDRDTPPMRISAALAELCSESPLPPTEILLPPKSISAEFGDLRVTTSAEEVVAVRAG